MNIVISSPPFLYTGFVVIVIALTAGVHFSLWRGMTSQLGIRIVWLAIICLLVGGWWSVDAAGKKEQSRLQQMLEGLPPTYAAELEKMGHWRLPNDAEPDDPLYLSMIEAELRWQKANPAANDIYTMRVAKDDTTQLIVDSETDYDHNGVFEGDTESRTDIGEIYDDPDDEMFEAMETGVTTFSSEPVTDRWGTWVSAYAPIRDAEGQIEAVVGVDFAASEWMSAILAARLTAMSYLGLLALAVLGIGSAGAIGMQRHEAESRRASVELERTSREKFETLVNSIQGIVWERNPETLAFEFVSAQAESILGYPPAEWTGTAGFWESKLLDSDREWAISQCRRFVQSGAPYHFDYRMLTAQGDELWIRESGAVVKDADGRPVLSRGVLSDVTSEKISARELEALNKQLVETSRQAGMAEIASGVLHNVGNVLNSVNVASNLVQESMTKSRLPGLAKLVEILNEQGPEGLPAFFATERGRLVPNYLGQLASHLTSEHQSVLKEIEGLAKNIEHIKHIVVMQQDYATVSGRIDPVNLRDLVDDALSINDSSFSRHGVRVVRDFQDDLPEVLTDRHKVLQVLVNLVRNAKHALDDSNATDRVLTVKLWKSGDTVSVSVSDNGIGIPQENLDRIFVHGFTTKKHGHGFGLHVSALAIQELDGELSGHSEGHGRGATFTVSLPVYVDAPAASAVVSTKGSSSSLSKNSPAPVHV
ncbi:MAG: PAS domain-containing protein [Verrucomicrobiales bacterium]